MAALAAAAPALSAIGTVLGFVGQMAAASSQQAVANYNAKLQEQQGKAEYAAATLKADKLRQEKERQIGRARTVAAASGGGQDYGLLGDLEEEGFYNSRLAIWEGEEALKGRKAQAAGTRFEGRARATASRVNAFRTVFDAIPTFYETYG